MKILALSSVEVSVVITVLNEEKNISALLNALARQTKRPNEIVIVDGGSSDQTVSNIKDLISSIKNLNIKLFISSGNRSVGRNHGVSKSSHEWIAFTDAGCVPDRDWLQKLKEAQVHSQSDVIAGYYYGLSKTNFQEAVVPYVLVMPDRVNKNNFLPATRSMLIKKSLFKKIAAFDERLSDNEDYELARRIKNAKCKIFFTKKAKVAWIPVKNLKEFIIMIFRFARGDAKARILRPKVLLIYFRYLLLAIFSIYLFWNLRFNIWNLFSVWILLFGIYALWSIVKNKKYVERAWYYLPVLQVSSDLAVMIGSIVGIFSF
ncbi:MAG: glycosyltransferase [Patescibacteria group bacterium]